VEANSTGDLGSRRAVAPSDDDESCKKLENSLKKLIFRTLFLRRRRAGGVI
jgi:hypothetical protein